MYHSTRARGILAGLKIGELDAKAKAANNLLLNPYSSGAARPGAAKGTGPYGLGAYDPKKPLSRLNGPSTPPTRPAIDEVAWRRYDLLSVTKLNHDTSLFRFSVPHKARLNVGMARHLSIGLTLKGKMTKREYTPITDEAGYFELMIKLYDEGPMSQHIHSLKVGDGAMMRGLYGKLQVKPDKWNHLFMFAAGTGIAPMMPFIRYWSMVAQKEAKEADSNLSPAPQTSDATSKSSKTLPKIARRVHLIYANKTTEDILLKAEIDKCVELGLGSFTVDYIVSRPPATEKDTKDTESSDGQLGTNIESRVGPRAADSISNDSISDISPTHHHTGRLSPLIMESVFGRSKSAWQNETLASGPITTETFALVCGPDGFADTVKSLLETEWHFPDTSYHVF